jgi:WD domain, G-beta repeat
VFTRLAATSSDGVDTADRATRAELTEGKSPAQAQDVEAVLEAFAAERLWDAVTGRAVRIIQANTTGPNAGLNGVAFSPSGKLLASADVDGTVRLWNTVTGQPVGAPIQAGDQTPVVWVTFSPDGKLLASASDDGTVRLWQISLFAHPYAALCAFVGPPTPQEWNQYAPGQTQPKVCG